jgi:hypothetical protein
MITGLSAVMPLVYTGGESMRHIFFWVIAGALVVLLVLRITGYI